MSKLTEKFERATAVLLVMPGGKQVALTETQRKACVHALEGNWANWERRCAALYQVIGTLADQLGVFETSDDVADALDVAAGRGDIEKLLPWPKDATFGRTPLPEELPNHTPLLTLEIMGWTLDVLDEVEALRRGVGVTHAGEDPVKRLRFYTPRREFLNKTTTDFCAAQATRSARVEQDYRSHWLMRHADGKEWETSCEYTLAEISGVEWKAKPVRRIEKPSSDIPRGVA